MLSIIIPIHNAERLISANIPRLIKKLDKLSKHWELIMAEDGSTDNSLAAAKKFKSTNVRILSSPKRLGRGLALNNAIRAAKGSIVAYMDADLATDLRYLPILIKEIECGSDIAIGSRLLGDSKVQGRNHLRMFFSRGYNLMLRLLFKTAVKDHQCGFKAFKKASIIKLLDEVQDVHFFWDSELLIRAQAKNLKVSEIPISWADNKYSTVDLASDVPVMGLAALALRLRI